MSDYSCTAWKKQKWTACIMEGIKKNSSGLCGWEGVATRYIERYYENK